MDNPGIELTDMENGTGMEKAGKKLKNNQEDKIVKKVRIAIEKNDFERTKELVIPKNLFCKDKGSLNVLERSLEVRYHLHNARGPNEKEFNLLGDKVEDFALCLLSYSKYCPDICFKREFRNSIEAFTKKALKCEAKKFLAGERTQDFLKRLWKRRFSTSACVWMLLHIWAVLEFFLFSFVFLILGFYSLFKNREDIDKDEWFQKTIKNLPKVTRDNILQKLEEMAGEDVDMDDLKTIYDVINECLKFDYADGILQILKLIPATSRATKDFLEKDLRRKNYDGVREKFKIILADGTNNGLIDKVLSKKAKHIQHIKTQRAKDLVMESLVTSDALNNEDSKFSKEEKDLVQKLVKYFKKDKSMKTLEDLVKQASRNDGFFEDFDSVKKDIRKFLNLLRNSDHSKGSHLGIEREEASFTLEKFVTIKMLDEECGKIQYMDGIYAIDHCFLGLLDRYNDHFNTPYFIFTRDMLSYVALLALHFAVCLQQTTFHLSVLEWLILVFFVGRVLIEFDQCVMQRSPRNYIKDVWNKMDILTLLIYVVTLTSRFLVTKSTSFLLKVGSYSYGLNAMILALRVSGHFMEVKQSTGTKQIALMKILKAVAVIFVQMVTTMLAFSLALTKIYMDESSQYGKINVDFLNATSHGVCERSVGILCWWHFFEFLAWSIVGSGDYQLLTLNSAFSNYFSKVLYLLFLIVAAVIIMNMLIALLSTKYQDVEDNAFKEWSFKKACMIYSYINYHPVPVPFCIISLPIKLIIFCLKKKKKDTNNSENQELETPEKQEKLLKKFFKRIKDCYMPEHGHSFPKDDASKIDRLMKQNRYLMGHIADEVLGESNFVSNSPDWTCEKGIKALGRKLVHERCDVCKKGNKKKYRYCVHGARHNKPLSEDHPGFEVLILQGGRKRFLGIGIANKDYKLFDFPGRKKHSVGYHIDTGKIFQQGKPIQELDAVRCLAGDVVSCMILFDRKKDDFFPVLFTRNGNVVGEAKLEADLINRGIYPLISMAHPGIHVFFRHVTKKPTVRIPQNIINVKILVEFLKETVTESAQKHICEHVLKFLESIHVKGETQDIAIDEEGSPVNDKDQSTDF